MLRDSFSTCPRCRRALDRKDAWLECGECHGALYDDKTLYDQISEAQIQALLTARTNEHWAREPFARTLAFEPSRDGAPTITCPGCESQMQKHTLYDVEVDHCPAHGVWLDGNNELRQVLRNAAARI